MSDLEKYINVESSTEPKLIRSAYVHYQFETIHPFSDGNGRIGRLLIVLQMIQLGLLSGPLVYPSVFFERTRPQYYSRLQGVRDSSKWDDWVSYFIEGMIFSANRTVELAQTIMNLQSSLRSQIETRKRTALRETLDSFFHHPVQTIRQAKERTGLSINSVASALAELTSLGIVREIHGSTIKLRGRVFVCGPIFDAIFSLPESIREE